MLQGFLFYLPKIIWGQFEKGKINSVCDEIQKLTRVDKNYEEAIKKAAKKVTDYMKNRKAGHLQYGIGYLSCQVLAQFLMF